MDLYRISSNEGMRYFLEVLMEVKQQIVITDKNKLEIDAVTSVRSFDEDGVLIDTSIGQISIEGKDLRIENFEKRYSIVLPEKYRLFISEFGGGYFGYANIYSLDINSNYFIMKHKLLVPKSYLPIADNGCGDYYVLKCNGEHCSDSVYFYTHDSQEINDTIYHDILEYLLDIGLKAL